MQLHAGKSDSCIILDLLDHKIWVIMTKVTNGDQPVQLFG